MLMKPACKGALASLGLLVLAACSGSHTGSDGGDGSHAMRDGSSNVQTAGLGNRNRFPGANAGEVNPETGERYNTVYFAFDNATIKPENMPLVRANADYLKSHPSAKLRLEGNTDPRGSREYNIGLGQRRGNSVDDALEMLGVSRSQLVVVSYGKEKLAVPGNTEEDYALDRRVEMVYEHA